MPPHAASAAIDAAPTTIHNRLRPLQQRTAARSSSGTASPTTGSATQTLTTNTPRGSSPNEHLVLRLRGASNRTRSNAEENTTEEDDQQQQDGPRIRWAEDVVDNEGLGRKSSKVCCIYHKARPVGESSSEDDSSSSSSDDEGGSSDGASPDDGGARMVGGGEGRKGRKGRGKRAGKGHEHGDDCGHGHGPGHEHAGGRRPSPNAYERMPRYRPQGSGGSKKP